MIQLNCQFIHILSVGLAEQLSNGHWEQIDLPNVQVVVKSRNSLCDFAYIYRSVWTSKQHVKRKQQIQFITMHRPLGLAFSLLSVAHGQLVGTNQPEVHPSMTWQSCTAKGSCTSNNGKVVIDANWRWLHDKNRYVSFQFSYH